MPVEALANFLGFCEQNYEADKYILYLVGHGMIVANDAFLADENPKNSGISLQQLSNQVLAKFPKLELLGLHSCSMSAVEVAYQLEDKTNHMLASEGPAFLGSWPYRQILMRLFKDPDQATADVVRGVFASSFYNNTDYQLAGYSFDLSWCDLSKLDTLTAPLQQLIKLLCTCLASKVKEVDLVAETLENEPARIGEIITGLILLAHWEAQSYWEESYTDLHDFCKVLANHCEKTLRILSAGNSTDENPAPLSEVLTNLKTACEKVYEALIPNQQGIIRRSENCGPAYQYSHGLSVYFPWSSPLTNRLDNDGTYAKYTFTTKFREINKDSSWLDFLASYLDKTERAPRYYNTSAPIALPNKRDGSDLAQIGLNFEDLANVLLSSVAGQLGDGNKVSPQVGRVSPVTGSGCNCPSIKNYPTRSGKTGGRSKQNKVPDIFPSPSRLKQLQSEPIETAEGADALPVTGEVPQPQ